MHRIFALWCGALLFGATSVAAEPAVSTILPVEHFSRHDEFGGIKLSPSGAHAAYLTGKYGRTILAFISVKDKKVTGLINCPGGFEIYDFDWSSNSRVVFSIAERQIGMVQPTRTGELLAVDYDGKRQKLIYGYRAEEGQTGTIIQRTREASYATPEIISPLLDDPENILIEEHPWKLGTSRWFYDRDAKPRIVLLNTVTGKKRNIDVAPLADASVLADHKDRVRFAVGRNERQKLMVSWKPDPEGRWEVFELQEFRDESVIPNHFSEDNQTVYFTGVREGESNFALYTINLANREIVKVYGFDGFDVSGVMHDLTGKRVVGVRSHADTPRVHWTNQEDRAARISQALHKAFPNQYVSIVTATADGRLAIVYASSDVNPGDYFFFDTQSMKADYLRSARKWIDPKAMRPKEPFVLQARDGLTLHGYLTKPNGAGPHPMVVLPHGGPHGVRDTWHFDDEVQLLANRGYAVLQVNFRGSEGFGMDFESAGYRNWGASMQDDVTDATQWAIRQGHADKNRICIYGASYGGYAALMGVAREPSLYRCAIGFAGVYDLELMLSSADIPRSKSGRAYLAVALGNDRDDLRVRSPVYRADKIQVPVLLIHGKEDWRADFEHAKRMRSALEAAGKPVEWMAVSREGHGVYDEESRREMYERMLAFLSKHLSATTDAK